MWGIAFAACAFPAPALAGEYYLYAPKEAESGKPPADPEEGVLVRAVTIRRGDTLKSIARKYTGRGSFFPQILLFNRIKNPDLIYAGNSLRVPVTGEAQEGTAVSRKAVAGKGKHRRGKASHVRAKVKEARTLPVERPPAAERPLFEKAVKAYRAGNCRNALEAFDRFLATYPTSSLVPDATLFRADCYLKLSGE